MGLVLLAWLAGCGENQAPAVSGSAQGGGASGAAGASAAGGGGAGGYPGEAAGAGAGGMGGQAGAASICDGSSAIRFAMRYTSPASAFPDWYADRYEIGARFLFVDGQCHYWMDSDPPIDPACGAIADYRTGTMSQATASLLASALSYGDPEQLKASCVGGILHAGVFHLWNGSGEFTCWDGFKEPEALQPVLDVLRQQSAQLEGPVRVGVAKSVETMSLPQGNVSWPLQSPPDDFLIPEEKKHDFGALTLVSDPNEVAKLRAIRDQWCALLHPFGYPISPMIVVDRETVSGVTRGTLVVYRQHLPFADPATGLWSPP